MSGQDRYEKIRALIEEADRIRSESERMNNAVDRELNKAPFWPERRRTARVPESPDSTAPDRS